MSRLMLSKLSTPALLTAVSFNQIIIGVTALLLAFLAALSVGYQAEGSLLTLLIVGIVSTLSVVAISILVAAFLKSIFELLTIGCFPFFILMFFSDVLFPLPKITLFHVAGNTVHANDLLPTTLTVSAFNEILNSLFYRSRSNAVLAVIIQLHLATALCLLNDFFHGRCDLICIHDDPTVNVSGCPACDLDHRRF